MVAADAVVPVSGQHARHLRYAAFARRISEALCVAVSVRSMRECCRFAAVACKQLPALKAVLQCESLRRACPEIISLPCRMWSIWMFTVPALRARDCSAAEKEVLNYLFLLIPVMNVTLPFVWKSFPFIYSADVAAMAALYAWKVGLPKAEEV